MKCLYKRGDVWYCRLKKDGKLFRHSLNTSRKDEALKTVEDMKIVMRGGCREGALKLVDVFFPPEKRGVKLSSAWETYVKLCKAIGRFDLSARTIESRKNAVNRLIKWLNRNAPRIDFVDEIDGPIAAAFVMHLASLKGKGGKTASPKTRKNIIAELSTIFVMLSKESSGIGNPWNGLMPRTDHTVRVGAFTPDQEKKVFAAARTVGKGWWLASMISRHTGLRYGDVANLTWSCINLSDRTINLSPVKTKRHGIVVMLPITQPLFDALNGEQKKGEYVLPNHHALYSVKSSASYYALNFREVLDAAGIPEGFTFHSWRHTFRSRLAEAGVSTETAMRLCGHTNKSTSAHYDHSTHMDEMRAAVDAAART